MRTRKVSLIIFYDRDKRILLQDRVGISKSGSEWGFFGGGIEEGETPEQAVVRETKEELDFELETWDYLGELQGNLTPDYGQHFFIFIAPLPDMSQMTLHEGKSMKLFSLERARTLKMNPLDMPVLDRVKQFLERNAITGSGEGDLR